MKHTDHQWAGAQCRSAKDIRLLGAGLNWQLDIPQGHPELEKVLAGHKFHVTGL